MVAVIDGSDDTIYSYFATNATPNGIVVNECSNKIYVANFGADNVTVYDGTTHNLITTITMQGGSPAPYGMDIHPRNGKVYVSVINTNDVQVINSSTDQIVAVVPVGNTPYNVTVDVARNRIYAINWSAGSVTVIDGSDNSVITTVSGVSADPLGADVLLY